MMRWQGISIVARLMEIIQPLWEGKDNSVAVGAQILRFDVKGALIEITLYYFTEATLQSPHNAYTSVKTPGWAYEVEARRGKPKPHLYLQDDGTFQENRHAISMGIPNIENREELDWQSLACDIAEKIYPAIEGCLLVHRRYKPGLHDVCKTCPQQLNCIATAKERPKKEKKKK